MTLSMVFRKTTIAAVLLLGASSVQAALSTSYTFNGKGGWSLDACGANSTNPVCTINAVVPTGSTIEAAFLYSSFTPANTAVPSVSFDGAVYSGGDWIDLGVNNANLRAYRADVTTQVAAAIGGGGGLFSFAIDSENPNSSIDGEILAIVYSNPAESERTIAFLDGFSATTGDSAQINLADPLTGSQLLDANFEATLSLGIGFGYQGDSQSSTVTVNGAVLTTCAGGQDDGVGSDGGLITVGGYGDDPTNNQNCNDSGPRQDDELYSLVPFLNAGDTAIDINTLNPSSDDNIFFAGINITARAGVNAPPPPPSASVSEPTSIALLSLGILGLGFGSIRKK